MKSVSKKVFSILVLLFVATSAFAFPQRIIIPPNVSSHSTVVASQTSVAFDFVRHTKTISIYNSSSADSIWVNIDGTTASSASSAEIPAGGTLSLDYDTTGIGIAGTGRTISGGQQTYIYATFQRE